MLANITFVSQKAQLNQKILNPGPKKLKKTLTKKKINLQNVTCITK